MTSSPSYTPFSTNRLVMLKAAVECNRHGWTQALLAHSSGRFSLHFLLGPVGVIASDGCG
jgi:hypothetical protein